MFRLKRHFSVVSFVAIVVTAAMLSFYYRHIAIENLIEQEEQSNLALTQIVANTLWQQYQGFLKNVESLPRSSILKHPLSAALHKDVAAMVHGLNVLKIKMFGVYGKTVFSTDSSQTGTIKPASYPGSIVARTGKIISKISHREKFRTIDGKHVYDRQVLSSYLPVIATAGNKVTGVIEIYTDITLALAEIERKQFEVIGYVLAILGLLYISLYAFISRADKILARQRNDYLQVTELSSRLGRLLDSTLNEIFIFAIDGCKYIQVNQGARDNLGYTMDELRVMTPWDLKPEYTREKFLTHIEPLRNGKVKQLNFETTHKRNDGSIYPVDVRLQLSQAEDPPVYVAMILDISERRKTEDDFRKLSRAIEQSPNTVVITDTDGRIEYVNPKFSELTGYSADDVLGKTPSLWQSNETPDAIYDELWGNIKDGEEWHGELLNKKKDGSFYWAAETNSAIRDENGKITHYILIQQDITNQKEAESQLNYLAYYDNLTGLPNRHLFSDRLQQAIKNADRNERLVAVLFIDLDRFKNINDSLGHETGDILLKEAAERLKGCIRANDTVARFGGDEFILVLSDLRHVNNAIKVANKIIDSFSKPFHINKMLLFVTTSIGITLYPLDDNDVDGLLKNADAAMYHAKDAGRNNFQLYSAEMTEKVEERLRVENDLRQALAHNEFELYYQPQVNISDGSIIGMEALIRWQHPQHGLLAPDQFINVAEESGLIVPIGNWVLREACKQNQALLSYGLQPILVSVNLSARQFRERDLVETIDQALKDTGLDPAQLGLEITESMLMSDTERVTRMLEELSALGVSIYVDDFGTGYSSLSYLKRFPISALKIDRTFICDIPNDQDDMAITQAVISMAKGLGIKTVAEGVETQEQLDFLKLHKCDLMQGFYFSKPIVYDEIVNLLRIEQDDIKSG